MSRRLRRQSEGIWTVDRSSRLRMTLPGHWRQIFRARATSPVRVTQRGLRKIRKRCVWRLRLKCKDFLKIRAFTPTRFATAAAGFSAQFDSLAPRIPASGAAVSVVTVPMPMRPERAAVVEPHSQDCGAERGFARTLAGSAKTESPGSPRFRVTSN